MIVAKPCLSAVSKISAIPVEARQVNPLSAYKPRPNEPNNPFMLEGCKRPSLGAKPLFNELLLLEKRENSAANVYIVAKVALVSFKRSNR
jgi:hypothetical protein